MPEVLKRPALPTRDRPHFEAYYKMAEAGILKRPERVELIDGTSPCHGPIPRLAWSYSSGSANEGNFVHSREPVRFADLT